MTPYCFQKKSMAAKKNWNYCPRMYKNNPIIEKKEAQNDYVLYTLLLVAEIKNCGT